MNFYRVALLFLLLLATPLLGAKEPLYVIGPQFEYTFDKQHLEFWSEKSLRTSYRSLNSDIFIKDPPASQSFSELGYDDQILWVKAKIHTDPTLPTKDWLLCMQPSDAFFVVDVFDEKGVALYRNLQADQMKNAEVSLQLDPGRDYTFVIHCARSNLITFKLTQLAFYKGQIENKEFDVGLFFGALAVLLLYNFFIYVSVRELSFLFYFFYLGGMIAVLGIMVGILPLNQYLTSFCMISMASFVFFTDSLLGVSKLFPRFKKGIQSVGVLGIFLGVLAAFPVHYFFMSYVETLGDLYLIFAFSSMLSIGSYLCFFRGQRNALVYVVGWSPLLAAVIFYLFRVHILKNPSGYWEIIALNSSALAQTLIFTAAFTYRVKHLQIENALQTEKAKDAERLRNLVRVICHDIANPLTVIQAYSSFKKDDPDTTWGMVSKASEKICDLVSRVKTLQALESKKQKVTNIPVPIDRFIMAITDTFDLKFKEKEIEFVLDVPPDLISQKIVVDPVLFESTVMNNLISNAIKFSYPKSKIWLRVSERDNMVIFEIEDHGLGIPNSLLEKIFSPHEKTSRAGTHGEKGTGFGMPLIKSLLESMDGRLELSSKSLDDHPSLTHGFTIFKVFVKKS